MLLEPGHTNAEQGVQLLIMALAGRFPIDLLEPPMAISFAGFASSVRGCPPAKLAAHI